MSNTGRKERVPTGRTNIHSSRDNINSDNNGNSNDIRSHREAKDTGIINTQRSSDKNAGQMYSSRSNTPVSSSRSTNSLDNMMLQLQITRNKQRLIQQQQELDELSDYNQYSRPRQSLTHPLRSVFFDKSVNNFSKSKTRSELIAKIKSTSKPHWSYDLDCDGDISHEDYRLAKKFDFDGNGILDLSERTMAKRMLADEFFKRNKHQLYLFGNNFTKSSHKTNVERLVASQTFELAYDKLKTLERSLEGQMTKEIEKCIKLPNDTALTRHNYYLDRFDTTAWNSFDAEPLFSSTYGLDEHGGSRKRLLFSRRQRDIVNSSIKLDASIANKPTINNKRMALITNVAIENN